MITVKSCYNALISRKLSTVNTWFWKILTLSKRKYYLWILSHNKLPTNDYLAHLNIIKNPLCTYYSRDNETLTHILFDCPASAPLWAHLGIIHLINSLRGSNIPLMQLLHQLITSYPHTTPLHVPPHTLIPFCGVSGYIATTIFLIANKI